MVFGAPDGDAEQRTLSHLQFLCGLLAEQVTAVAGKGLRSLKDYPLYSVLGCIHNVLQGSNPPQPPRDDWKAVLAQVLRLVGAVLDMCSPVVFDASPEGFMPDDAAESADWDVSGTEADMADLTLTGADADADADADAGSASADSHASRVVLASSWRSIRECAQIMALAATRYSSTQCGVGPADAAALPHIIFSLLMQARHRGAVEMVAVAFQQLCQHAVVSDNAELAGMPKHFLHEVLGAMRGGGGAVTRRSAGYPCAVLAVLSAELLLKQRALFDATVTAILNATEGLGADCSDEAALDRAGIDSRVHHLNILRVLLRDTRFAGPLLPHLTTIAIISMNGSKSAHFSVRNSCSMLFSVVMLRLFGCKRVRDEHDARHNLSLTEFCTRYPVLSTHLQQRLALLAEGPGAVNVPAPQLMPILLIMSRLTLPSADSAPMSDAFNAAALTRCLRVFLSRFAFATTRWPLIVSARTRESANWQLRPVLHCSRQTCSSRNSPAWLQNWDPSCPRMPSTAASSWHFAVCSCSRSQLPMPARRCSTRCCWSSASHWHRPTPRWWRKSCINCLTCQPTSSSCRHIIRDLLHALRPPQRCRRGCRAPHNSGLHC